jgi:hypothetical protein
MRWQQRIGALELQGLFPDVLIAHWVRGSRLWQIIKRDLGHHPLAQQVFKNLM